MQGTEGGTGSHPNPLLPTPHQCLQLLRICRRIAGLSLHSSLKEIAAGVELLLARAQEWELSAAKHVSLDKELTVLLSLVGRWRKFELIGWRSWIDRIKDRSTKMANKVCIAEVSPRCKCLMQQSQLMMPVLAKLIDTPRHPPRSSGLPCMGWYLPLKVSARARLVLCSQDCSQSWSSRWR